MLLVIQTTPQGLNNISQVGFIPFVQIEQNDIIVQGEIEGDTLLNSSTQHSLTSNTFYRTCCEPLVEPMWSLRKEAMQWKPPWKLIETIEGRIISKRKLKWLFV